MRLGPKAPRGWVGRTWRGYSGGPAPTSLHAHLPLPVPHGGAPGSVNPRVQSRVRIPRPPRSWGSPTMAPQSARTSALTRSPRCVPEGQGQEAVEVQGGRWGPE